jgi:triosephosphate isomerase
MPPRPLIAGNWKMNGLRDSAGELGQMIAGQGELGSRLDLLICPPATLLMSFAERAAGSALKIGAQDCHPEASGAHTGDISAGMVADVGGAAVIVGHSERRADHGESDSLVRSKAEAAWRAGLIAIICVGETEQQRNNGEAKTVVGSQLEGSVPDGADAASTASSARP